MRPSLESCMMHMAYKFAERSTCKRLSVGCIITNENMTSVDAIGYNGGPKGIYNDCLNDTPGACGHAHAEMNSLNKANFNIKNKKAFITHSPCGICAILLINHEIKEVYISELYRDLSPLKLLLQADVKVFKMDLKNNEIHIVTSQSIF